ncbi:hypothetical protein ACFWOL_34385 [Streptomyces sp. NPDC058442]|uniref:hypothetical protein n=1 Tax=Streptomyces sp. NPDC058442 TaxID=3346503 RepID=UPI003653DAC6
MARVEHQHFVAVVEQLTARWLRGNERELPLERRAGLIGERALDAYESTEQEGTLPDAVAALGAATALGSDLPTLRRRLDHLSDVPAPYAVPRSAELQGQVEHDADRFDELRDLLRVHAGGNRTAYRVPRPALTAARGYESEIPSLSLLILTCQIRDALNAPSDEADDAPTAGHIQLSARDRTRLLRSASARDTDALDRAIDRLQTAIDSSTDEPLPWAWSFTLSDLAQSLLLRYEAVGQPSDLERAVDNARAAIRLAQGAGERDASLVWTGVLGAALRMRYEAGGNVGDLKAAADSLWETTNPTSLRVEQSVWTSWLCAVGALQRYHYALSACSLWSGLEHRVGHCHSPGHSPDGRTASA